MFPVYLFIALNLAMVLFFALVYFKPELIDPAFYKWAQNWATELGLELRSFHYNGLELGGLRGDVHVTMVWTGPLTRVQVDRSEWQERPEVRLLTGDHPFDA